MSPGHAHGHHGGFGHGGRAIVHGSVGDVHAGELADHGLEFENGGQGALRDLGLIGRVGGEESPRETTVSTTTGRKWRYTPAPRNDGYSRSRRRVPGSIRQSRIRRFPARGSADDRGQRLWADARTAHRGFASRKPPASPGVRSQTSEDSAISFRPPHIPDTPRPS